MRVSIALAIARKELREALRDRKTIVLTLLLPLLLYPGLMLLVTQIAMTQQAALEAVPSNVAIIGDISSAPAQALRDAELLRVIELDAPVADPLAIGADAIVTLTPQLDANGTTLAWNTGVQYRSVIETSQQAADRVQAVLSDWRDVEVTSRIAAAGLPPETIAPIQLAPADLSPTQQRGGYVLGSVLPLLVLITIMMGSLYPAIDVTAGEKERGTIQTLFTAPVHPSEVVAGKYLAVVALGMVTGASNLGSMALVFGHNLVLSGEAVGDLDFTIAPSVFFGLAIVVVLIAALVSAVLMCAAVLARSFKDAQTFVTPVYLLCLLPGLVAQMPGFELTSSTALVPIVGPVLLMRSMLLDGVQLDEVFLVCAGSSAWIALAVLLATKLFDSEDVITGGRATLAAFASRSGLVPEDRADVGTALAWYGVSILLLYYVGSALQTWSPRVGLVLTLWLVLLAPTLLLARRLKLRIRAAFALSLPKPRYVVAAVLLGSSFFVLVAALAGLLEPWLPQPSKELTDRMVSDLARFFPTPTNALEYGALLFVGAISPAICEELLFRGFILSSLRSRVSDAVAVLLTAALFAVFHLSIYRLFGTALLGVVMGMLVVRSGSIVPAMIFHGLNNAMALLLLPSGAAESDAADAEQMLGRALPIALVATALGLVLALKRTSVARPLRD